MSRVRLDQLLVEVARRLNTVAGDAGRVYRLGGDEFVVVMPDCGDPRRITELVEAMLRQLAEPFEVNEHVLHIGGSAGIAVAPQDGTSVDELIAKGEQLETSGEALVVSVCAGFSRANIRDVGPSVTVTVDTARGDTRPQAEAAIERQRVFGRAPAAQEARAVGLPLDRPVHPAFHAQDVHGPRGQLVVRPRAPAAQQRRALGPVLGLEEEFEEGRMGEILRQRRQHHLDHAGHLDLA